MQLDQLKRREFVALLGGAAVWRELVRRIGVLTAFASDDPAQQSRVLAFAQALAQSGWTEGRNVRIDIRWSVGTADDTARYAAELVALALRAQKLRAYPAMPPLIREKLPDGTVERTIALGLMPSEGARGHEIVGVNMIRRSVLRFEPSDRGRAPENAAAHNPICAFPMRSKERRATPRAASG